MNWYINDLSLSGQFPDPSSFRLVLEPLMRFMMSRKEEQVNILCSRELSLRMVSADHTLPQAVRALQDPNFTAIVLRWVSKNGPFWETDRTENPDDLFIYEREDVTNQGLGEAARRLAARLQAATFSFAEPTGAKFAMSPLPVVHGLLEEPFGTYDVQNIWDVGDFPKKNVNVPDSWGQMVETIRSEMPELILSGNAAEPLKSRPYDPGAATHMLSLLRVLQKLTVETMSDGKWTPAGMELYSLYCMRKGARISDSSDGEKVDFKNELTFPDPSDSNETLFCPWHAKLNFGGQYRIHFEWPRPTGQRSIKVVYLGPKITRY